MTSINDGFDDGGSEFSLSNERVSAPRVARIAAIPNSLVHDGPLQNSDEAPAMDASRYLHAIRRNWLLGAVLGILAAGPFAAAMWFLNPEKYTATEFVRISPNHTPLVFETAETTGKFDFKSYKNTQRQLMVQPFVLNSALKVSEVASLPFIQQNPDPIGWLQKELRLSFPDEAEIMNVSLTTKDPVVSHRIVKAIVDTYMRDVVEKEQAERMGRVDRLEKILAAAEDKVRKKRGELTGLVDSLGTGDQVTLNIAQQSSLQQLGLLRGELSKISFDLRRAKGELQARVGAGTNAAAESQNPKVKSEEKGAGEKSATGTSTTSVSSAQPNDSKSGSSSDKAGSSASPVAEINDIALEEALEADPAASALKKEIEYKQNLIRQTKVKYDARTAESYVKKYQTELDDAQRKLAERTKRVQRIVEASSGNSKLERTDLPIKIEVLEKTESQLRDEMKVIEAEAKKLGRSSIDVEMMRKEIGDLDPLVSRVSQEIERTKIELQSSSRITLFPTSGVPQIGTNKKRLPLTAAAGLLGLFGPLALLVLRDYFRNHVNHSGMINKDMNISVLGSIPRVPTRVMKRLNDPEHKDARHWRERIAESVTAVTSMLLRTLATDGHRVVMVSSAMPAEGKSTLAGLLARSLAASGHRTLLIDFDLRRPQLHRRFEATLAPGVCEVLRQGADLKLAARQTDTPNLSILTAGKCKGTLLLEAANGTLEALFKECREEYELVVVDSSPLLPVVDGRLVGQFADGAILTVVKDTSKVPQIIAARKILDDYGIETFGCVVTGENNDSYYDAYQAMEETQGPIARGVSATRSMSAM